MAKLKILYKGPGDSINVGGFGKHLRDEIKPYPDEFAKNLLLTSKKQCFVLIKPETPNKKKRQSAFA